MNVIEFVVVIPLALGYWLVQKCSPEKVRCWLGLHPEAPSPTIDTINPDATVRLCRCK